MAITEFKETHTGRTGSLDLRAVRTYQRTFRVRTNSTLDDPLLLIAAFGLGIGVPYVSPAGLIDAGARCVKITPRQEADDPFQWELSAEYASGRFPVEQRNAGGGLDGSGQAGSGQVPSAGRDGGADLGGTVTGPLDKPPVYGVDFNRYSRVSYTDVNGAPATNSAGVWFSPLPETDDSRLVLNVQQNEASVDLETLIAYQDAVNSDAFLGGVLPGQCKVTVKAGSAYENGEYYWPHTYVFEFRRDGFVEQLLDQGLSQIDANGKLVPILASNGTPVSEPVLLDGNGHVRLANDPNQYYYRPFVKYKSLPFAVFNTPGTIN